MPIPRGLSWKILGSLAVALSLCSTAAAAQTPGEEAVPCPPSFPAFYQNPNLDDMTFWGRSRLMMRQPDGTYGYHFVGETTDGEWKVSGNHVVAARQCLDAAYSYWMGIPAVVIRLWNEQLYYIGSGSGDGCGGGEGAGGGEYITSHDEIAVYSSDYDPYASEPPCGGGTGGGGGGVPGFTCSYDYVTLEISKDGGQTWEVWWAGWTLVCVQAA